MDSNEQLLSDDNLLPVMLEIPSREEPEWAFARTKRCVLMAPSVEWVQSVYSCYFEFNQRKIVTPNRDYAYEGLLAYLGGEHWKLIDCVALSLHQVNGVSVPFIQDDSIPTVKISPWIVTYNYRVLPINSIDDKKNIGLPIRMSYYLHTVNTPEFISGCIELSFPSGLGYQGIHVSPRLQPFVDIRHMYSSSEFNLYSVQQDKIRNSLHMTYGGRTLSFYLPSVNIQTFDNPEMMNWHYKLGTGTRIESISQNKMETVFTAEEKTTASFFSLQVPAHYSGNFIRLYWGCGMNEIPKRYNWKDLDTLFRKSREKDRTNYRMQTKQFSIPKSVPYRNSIYARITGLTKYKTYIQLADKSDYVQVPHAGAWWFRTPWFRDLFEGILNSFNVLMQIPDEKNNIRKIVQLALSTQDETTGRILNRIPEFKNNEKCFNNTDGTLLCFIVANMYVKETHEAKIAYQILHAALKVITLFSKETESKGESHINDGPPRIDHKTGLLLSVPHHSWIDTHGMCVEYAGWKIENIPNRLSAKFIRDLYDSFEDVDKLKSIVDSPNFFLPEINAQWILFLQGTLSTIEFLLAEQKEQKSEKNELLKYKRQIEALYSLSVENFKSVFINSENGFLFNSVYWNQKIRDRIECETGITAAAFLGNIVFSDAELSGIWIYVKRNMLVNRTPTLYGSKYVPFGVITKNEDQRIYYNDSQYHSDVIWPRSTPYLIKLLSLLNDYKTIEHLLVNALDHQMNEAALFYNQELFSRPSGNTPFKDQPTFKNPVPVKNPIQFWSQWSDAFIEYFSKRGE
jgi:hypothetical protein